MLTKLLKYDLKYMIKRMIVFYILSIFFAILTRIFYSINQTIIVQIIKGISQGCLITFLINIILNTIIISWVRFTDSLYKDESYLTHTLPVTKTELYESRFIQTLIFSVIGFIIMLISLLIAYYTKDRWLLLTNVINELSTGLNIKVTPFIVSIITILFLEIFNMIQCGFFGIILGFRKNNLKILFSFIYTFITYILSQSLVLLFVFIVGLFNSSIMDLFKNTIVLNNNSIKLLISLVIFIYSIIIIIMNILSTKQLSKGVNIE